MENNESNDNIMDRILQGKDLKSEIDKFVVVGPYTVFNRHFQTGDYSIWNFHFAKIFMGIPFSKIKNLFVNPDFGKEGLHSKRIIALNFTAMSQRCTYTIRHLYALEI